MLGMQRHSSQLFMPHALTPLLLLDGHCIELCDRVLRQAGLLGGPPSQGTPDGSYTLTWFCARVSCWQCPAHVLAARRACVVNSLRAVQGIMVNDK